jgi:pimeloyl-ACP methyl ester carboxylesterase
MTDRVISRDGTPISYHTVGAGDLHVVVVGGVLRSAEDYLPLARALGASLTVHVVDRRGRGASGPLGPAYSLERECEDLATVCAQSKATRVFGHSYGGLVALEAAARLPALTHVAVYEPPVGSVRLGWVDRYAELLAAGDRRGAFAWMVRGAGHAPAALSRLPLWCLKSILRVGIRPGQWQRMEPLLEANLLEHRQLQNRPESSKPFGAIRARVLMLGGARTPSFATRPLAELCAMIPDARLEMVPGVGHNAPDETAPELIAARLARFLAC